MRHTNRAVAVAGVLSLTVATSSMAQEAPDRIQPLELREDLDVLERSLLEGHPGLTRHAPWEILQSRFHDLRDSLTKPLTQVEFYRVLTPAIAAIRCGHTRVSFPDELEARFDASQPLLPFYVRIVDSRVIVIRDLSDIAETMVGREIRSIDGVSSEQILADLYAATPVDGFIRSTLPRQNEGWAFSRGLARRTDLGPIFDVVLADRDGARVDTVTLRGSSFNSLEGRWGGRFPGREVPEHAADLRFAGATAILTLRRFWGVTDSTGGKGFLQFFERAFARIDEEGAEGLIIDVRDNGGGEDDAGAMLLSHLVDRPFRYYADIVYNDTSFALFQYTDDPPRIPTEYLPQRLGDGRFHWSDASDETMGWVAPSSPSFNGPVVIVMNGRSFSTTAEFLAIARYQNRAIFVGEESGGAVSGATADTLLQ